MRNNIITGNRAKSKHMWSHPNLKHPRVDQDYLRGHLTISSRVLCQAHTHPGCTLLSMEPGRINQGGPDEMLGRNLTFFSSILPSQSPPTTCPQTWSLLETSLTLVRVCGPSLEAAAEHRSVRSLGSLCHMRRGQPHPKSELSPPVALGSLSRSASTENLLAQSQGFPQSYSTGNSGMRSRKSVSTWSILWMQETSWQS